MNNHQKLQDYRSTLSKNLDKLDELTDKLNYKPFSHKLKEFRKSSQKESFIVTVVGEFNRGKSTLLNAIIGEDIIPTGILPTTATINIIRYDKSKRIIIHNSNDEILEIPFNKDELTNYTALADFNPDSVKYVEITLPNKILEEGIVLVDTPGVNDINQQRIEITYGYLPLSDVIIFILNASTPLKKTEVEFLTEHILSNNINKIFFVSNQIDHLDESELLDSLESMSNNLQGLLKNDEIKVYPLSSREALMGRVSEDEQRIFKSKIVQFEEILFSYLQSDEKNNLKIERLNYQFEYLLDQIFNEINAEMIINHQSLDELFSIKSRLEKSEGKLRENFSRLLSYIDEQSNQLQKRIETSLLNKMKEVNDNLNFHIEKYQADLTEFVEKDIPYSIKKTLKMWVEQSQPSIDQSITAIYQKSYQGYERHFSKLPLIEAVVPNQKGQNLSVNPTEISLKNRNFTQDISKKTFAAGAILLGVTATLASGGILTALFGAIGGGTIAQRFWGQNLIKKEIELQKAEIKTKLPQVLAETFNSFFAVLVYNISVNFTLLKANLEKEFNHNLSRILVDINTNIEDRAKDINIAETKNLDLEKSKEIILSIKQWSSDGI